MLIKYLSLNHIRALEFIGIFGISALYIYRFKEKSFYTGRVIIRWFEGK
jgi:hypothetical protein